MQKTFTSRFSVIATAIFAVAVAHNTAAGQDNFRFSSLGIEQGLSQSCVTSIYQDEFNMVWVGTQDGLNRYDGSRVKTFRPVAGDATTLFSNNIKTVCGDHNGNLYVLCKYALCRMDMRTEKFHTIRRAGIQAIAHTRDRLWASSENTIYRMQGDSLEEYCSLDDSARISCLYESSSGFLWVGTVSAGVRIIDANRKQTTVLPDRRVVNIYEDSKHNMWVATQRNGLYRIDISGAVTNMRHDPKDRQSLSDDYVRAVCEDDQGHYWIGTMKGVNILDPQTQAFRHADHSNQDPHSLSHSSIWCIIKDHQGTMWIGSYFGGISIYNRENDVYTFHRQLFANPRLSVISCMTDNGQGDLWMGTEGTGLIRYNPARGTIREYGEGMLSSGSIKSLWLDKRHGVLWVGTLLGGLNRLDIATGKVQVFRSQPGNPNSLPNNNIRRIIPYGEGELLLATHRGVVLFDVATSRCTKLSAEASGKYISDMMLDSQGNCWVAASEGVVRHNMKSGRSEEYFCELDSPLGPNHILVFFADSRGRIWLGSSGGGLFRYEPESNSFTSINSSNSGLINDYILDIKESEAGYLLLATNKGFVRYDPDQGVFYNYDAGSGFPVSDILPYGLYVDAAHDIYVCGYKSLISFNENNLMRVSRPMNLYFTSLSVNNKEVAVDGQDGILTESMLYQNQIDLYPRHSTIAINYATSSYAPYENARTEYRLKGFSNEWIKGVKGQPIIFTNLEPKTYRLEIRSVDGHSHATIAYNALTITMHPPFYKTAWAILIMVVIVLSTAVWLTRFYISKLRLRASLELEKREKVQVQEMTQSKVRFFTYVSHELRTPVTLIQSQCDAIMQKPDISPSVYNRMIGIQGNLNKINRLINELLDFKRQEQDFQQMAFSGHDMVALLGKVYLTFREYAAERSIRFSFEHPDTPVEVWCDAEQLEKVFYNLLSNAFKYTKAGGEITVSLIAAQDNAVVKVSDTGSGIEARHQQHIFDPFYQAPHKGDGVLGSGLGLSITKGIVVAHYGHISLDSEPGQGSVFTVSIPMGKEHIPQEYLHTKKDEDSKCIEDLGAVDARFIEEVMRSRSETGIEEMPTIMIVEDNDELRGLLVALFTPLYKVVEACDGQDALQKLDSSAPDIILSDLMMPRVDGNELCRKVKGDFATSHIPFVILTAQVAVESALEGFRHGADDYIAKPFNSRILVTKCNNLVNSRAHLQAKFARSTSLTPSMLVTTRMDEELIEKAVEVVIRNISNPDFDIVLFAREMALGRTMLFSKLKGVTGQTPNQFITNIRLKHSVTLLRQHPELSVGEVAFMVGFNSPSYFIKSFRMLYGLTPVAFREQGSL